METTIAAAPTAVSPFSDVIVPRNGGRSPRVLRSRHREPKHRSRLAGMRPRADRARRAVRRTVLHRRVDDADLLPSHLSGEARPVAQRRLLPHGGRRRARGLPPLLAMSPQGRAGNTSVAGCCVDGLAGTGAHRARIPRRWRDGRGPRGHARDDDPTPAPTLLTACGGLSDCRRDDPARATRENADRRDRHADVHDRIRRGVQEHSTIQRRVSRSV